MSDPQRGVVDEPSSLADPIPLHESAEDLYEDAPAGYVSARPDGTIVRANRTFLRWLGYTREELVGRRRLQDLLTSGGQIYHETHYAPLLRMQGRVREIAVEFVRSDGEHVPALLNSVLITDGAGRPVTVRTTVFDATERRRYEHELLLERRRAKESEARARELARTLQASLIPPAAPEIPGLDVGAAYRPAGSGDEVGGDFYDAFEVAGGEWAVIVGDVQGKGAAAATITALARYTARAAAMRSPVPSEVLTTVHEALISQHPDRLCTAVYGRLRPNDAGMRLTLCAGGHPLPLRIDGEGNISAIGRSGRLLGLLGAPQLEDVEVDLVPGDVIVLYTDGVVEARSGDGFFGDDRLCVLLGELRTAPAAAIAERLVAEVVAFQQGDARDDIAVVVLKIPG